MIRKTVVVLLALLALSSIAAPALLGSSDRTSFEDAVDEILLDDTLNNGRAEGAPQQQVVTGWTARDLLALQSAQHNDLLELQSRQMMLLLVIALLLAWSVVSSARIPTTAPAHGRRHRVDDEDAPPTLSESTASADSSVAESPDGA